MKDTSFEPGETVFQTHNWRQEINDNTFSCMAVLSFSVLGGSDHIPWSFMYDHKLPLTSPTDNKPRKTMVDNTGTRPPFIHNVLTGTVFPRIGMHTGWCRRANFHSLVCHLSAAPTGKQAAQYLDPSAGIVFAKFSKFGAKRAGPRM